MLDKYSPFGRRAGAGAASLLLASFAFITACGSDSATAPHKATSVTVSGGDAQAGIVGQPLAVAPTFIVNDEAGHPLAGVNVTLVVTAGNGTLATSTVTSSAGPTSIGTWTLGPKSGTNTVTATVGGLAPVTFTALARAGAAAKITSSSSPAIIGRVATGLAPITVHVTDAFDNPLAGVVVSATVTTGSVGATQTTDGLGNVTIADWVGGQIAGPSVLTLSVGAIKASIAATLAPGDPATITTTSGDHQSAFAGAVLAAPIVVRVADRFGNAIGGQAVTIAAIAGGGTPGQSTVTTAADGTLSLASWTLGRTALPQTLELSAGDARDDITATVQTDFHIDVRFFGPDMTDAQKALFTNAAARLSAIVVTALPPARLVNLNLARACGLAGLPVLNETTNSLIIYASVQNIDGPKNILAQSGPCAFRPSAQGYLTTAGVMEFDSADLPTIDAQGILQDVITHEMLHVLGIGTLWEARNLLIAPGSFLVGYTGAGGLQGCIVGAVGSSVCAGGVPVENNGVVGTADSHWRESIFQSELMTGYVNQGGMPLSTITIGALGDLGYVVNMLAADPYTVPKSSAARDAVPIAAPGWERSLPGPGAVISPNGGVEYLRKP